MIADRFFEPETVSLNEILEADYERYINNLDDDEEPLTLEEYREVYIW